MEESEFSKDLTDEIAADFTKQARRIPCPVHGLQPNVRMKLGSDGKTFRVIGGCCKKFESVVSEHLE